VVERVELQIDGIYQVESLYHRKCILCFHGKYTKKSQWLTVPGDTAECCAVSEIVFSFTLHLAERTPLIPAEESIPQLPTLSSSSYGLLGSYAVSAELHGVTLKDRNLIA